MANIKEKFHFHLVRTQLKGRRLVIFFITLMNPIVTIFTKKSLSRLLLANANESLTLSTARKRSLRRLCFHRCLPVHSGGSLSGGVICLEGLCPGRVSVQGDPAVR